MRKPSWDDGTRHIGEVIPRVIRDIARAHEKEVKSKMTKAKRKSKFRATKKLVKKEYTEEEKACIANYVNRLKKKPIKAEFSKADNGRADLHFLGEDEALKGAKCCETFGTTDERLQELFLNQALVTSPGVVSSKGVDHDMLGRQGNNVLAMLNGIQPRDELEGMLAVQMIGVHNMAMESLRRAMIQDQTFEGRQTNVNYATKMVRTFMAQIEALMKYRTAGQQKIVVEHVHVNEGGQAIVGVVNQGGGGSNSRR